jgi:hypothetical protein
VHPPPGELTVNADDAGLVVDVGPGEPERFPDPQPGVGEELKQEPVGARVVEELPDLVGFEDRAQRVTFRPDLTTKNF